MTITKKHSILPLVSIGIPTYNRPDGLVRTLESVTKQSYSNIEIIISDNASTDGKTESVVQKYIRTDPKIRYIRQQENIGSLKNFEFLVKQANGKYFMWVADDDMCEPTMVEELVATMLLDNEIALCGCDVKVVNEADQLLKIENLDKLYCDKDWGEAKRNCFNYPVSNVYLVIYGLFKTSVLKRKDVKIKAGWKGYLTSSEFPFIAKIATIGKIVAIPRALKIYRRHEESGYSKEVKKMSIVDRNLVRVVVRLELIRIALICDESIKNKIGFIKSIFTIGVKS